MKQKVKIKSNGTAVYPRWGACRRPYPSSAVPYHPPIEESFVPTAISARSSFA